MKWYGMQRGKITGVYNSWAKYGDQVIGYNNKNKWFKTREQAEEYTWTL
jgi:viroplasmin and RNaseH domain-containing protein